MIDNSFNKLRDIQVRQGRIIQALRFLSKEVTSNNIKDIGVLQSKIKEGLQLTEDFQGIRDEMVAMGYKSHPKAQYLFSEFWSNMLSSDEPTSSCEGSNKYHICLSWSEYPNNDLEHTIGILINYLTEFNAKCFLNDKYIVVDHNECVYKYELTITEPEYNIINKSLSLIANAIIGDKIEYGIYWKKI